MKFETISKPYEVQMGRQDDRLVEITIRAVGDTGELGYDEIREATRSILDYARREHRPALGPRLDSEAVRVMVTAYNEGHGRVTDEYLARLAVAYAELAPKGRNVSMGLAMALGKPVPTVKGHIMRARREGFLTDAIEGREGGEPTAKALELSNPS